jgi:hypothetical protein
LSELSGQRRGRKIQQRTVYLNWAYFDQK